MTDSKAGSVAAFECLHPAVQYHVVNSLGWPGLRPLQEESVAPILDGDHALLIAPTAGGKTEAAMLPVLSRMLSEEWRGVSVLYICPIKALLNNLEVRLSALAGLLGRTVQLWHGDIAQSEKLRTERELPDILLTTPESLEGILIGSRRDHQHLLGNVRCVVVDELHAFAGDDRGWHLLALLERIRALGQCKIQRIGLSATVGDPERLLDWLAEHASGKRSLVHIQAAHSNVDIQVDYVGSLQNAAILISRLHQGEKRLVFCDSRSRVEELAIALRSLNVDVFVSHAALSADTRRQAEQAFAERQNCVIVATSTLELGLDVGDLDRVIQIDAPGSVASFLQRLGRTGRRSDMTRNTLFITTRDDGLLEALAIVHLFQSGYVEPVQSPPAPYHLIVQQLFAMLFQSGGEIEERWFIETLSRVPGFAELICQDWVQIRDHLISTEHLVRSGFMISLGEKSKAKFSGKKFADLCVSFDPPRAFTVRHGNVVLGQIDPISLSGYKEGKVVLALGGRSWSVASVDWQRERIYVAATRAKGSSRWFSEARGVSKDITNQVRKILEDPKKANISMLTKRATERLAEISIEKAHTLLAIPNRLESSMYEWSTYAGLAENVALAAKIKGAGGICSTVGSYSLRFYLDEESLEAAGGWKGIQSAEPLWEQLNNLHLKFSDLLPDRLSQEILVQRIMSA